MKYILGIVLSASVGFSQTAMAQSWQQKKGDKAYDQLAFIDARDLYLQVADNKKSNADVLQKLGDCHRFLGETAKAEERYKQAIDSGANAGGIYFQYAQMLRSNGKYQEAQTWDAKFKEQAPNDQRATNFLKEANYYEKLMVDKGKFTVSPLSINSDRSDFGAVYFKDHVVFSSARKASTQIKRSSGWDDEPFLDLYMAQPDDAGDLSSISKVSNQVNTRYHEGVCSFNAEGTVMYFTRNGFQKGKKSSSAEGVVNLKIFRREWKDEEWVNEVSLALNNDEYSVGHPSLSPDGKYLYFISNMPGGKGGTDIYRAEILGEDKFGTPENLTALNTEGNEMFPFVHADGMLFFSSDGHAGLGGLDVFVSTITNGKFGIARNVGVPLNGEADDFAFVLNKEMTKGYFSSNREGGVGGDDLYRFDLHKPLKSAYLVEGVVSDDSGTPIADAEVQLRDESGKVIQAVRTDASGAYGFDLEKDKTYYVAANKEKHFEEKVKFEANEKEGEEPLSKDLSLVKDTGLSLFCEFNDAKSALPVEGAQVTLIDELSGEEIATFATDGEGDFRHVLKDKKLGDDFKYTLKIEKPGYLVKTVAFEGRFQTEGEKRLNDSFNLNLTEIEVGSDMAKYIGVEPIYFDYNEAVIREDAAFELDKVVRVMLDNPSLVIELRSHTDSRGGDSHNKELSAKRAQASAEYIISRGIDEKRIYGKGYGERQLLNICTEEVECSEEEHERNRRTEFIITQL